MSCTGRYRELGCPFAGTLANAALDLPTFLLHPGMDPTNNDSENELRKMAAHRKIHMRKFGTLLTCTATRRRRGLDPTEQLLRVLSGSV